MTASPDHIVILPILLPMLSAVLLTLIDDRFRAIKSAIGLCSAVVLVAVALILVLPTFDAGPSATEPRSAARARSTAGSSSITSCRGSPHLQASARTVTKSRVASVAVQDGGSSGPPCRIGPGTSPSAGTAGPPGAAPDWRPVC